MIDGAEILRGSRSCGNRVGWSSEGSPILEKPYQSGGKARRAASLQLAFLRASTSIGCWFAKHLRESWKVGRIRGFFIAGYISRFVSVGSDWRRISNESPMNLQWISNESPMNLPWISEAGKSGPEKMEGIIGSGFELAGWVGWGGGRGKSMQQKYMKMKSKLFKLSQNLFKKFKGKRDEERKKERKKEREKERKWKTTENNCGWITCCFQK